MELSGWIVAGVIELYFVLLILCAFLILNIKNLRKLVGTLRDKVKGLVEELNQARSQNVELAEQKALAEMRADPAPNFREQIQKQIELTEDFHDELPGSQGIGAYLDPKQPIQRQSLAFRHAVLCAELEAQDADGDVHPNWALLQSKFGKLINFYKEKFARAGDQAEPKPDQSSTDLPANTEQLIHDLLIEAAGGLAPDNLEVLLDKFRSSTSRKESPSPPPTAQEQNNDGAQDLASLRALAEKQRLTILDLQNRLANPGQEDFDTLVSDLNSQLSRQERFLKESESCIKLLEDELEMANAKIEQLKHQRRSGSSEKDALAGSLKQELTHQNEQLRARVKQQEAEIEQLLAQLHMGS